MSKQNAILRPLALAFVLAAGFAVVFGILIGWLNELRTEYFGGNFVCEGADVRDDGEPVIRRNVSEHGRYRQTFRTLDGVEVPEPHDWAFGAALYFPPKREVGEFPRRVWSLSTGYLGSGVWYFVYDGQRNGRGYFVGFRDDSKRLLGFIGRDGFREKSLPRSEWFSIDGPKFARTGIASFPPGYWSPSYSGQFLNSDMPPWKINLIADDQLLQVDVSDRSVKTLVKSTDLISLGMDEAVPRAKAAREPAGATMHHVHLAVRTPDHVLLFDAAGKQQGSYSIPSDLRDEHFLFYELGSGTALLQAMPGALAAGRDPRYSLRQEFVWIDTSRTILRRKTVVLEDTRDDDQPWLVMSIIPAPITAAFLTLLPVLSSSMPDPLAQRLSFPVLWPSLVAVSILSAALAWLCYRRQRRYAQPWTAVWVAFVLLTGLPGLVGYLCHRRWPVLEACPACGRLVPRDRGACAACGAEFPPPPKKGIEVFA